MQKPSILILGCGYLGRRLAQQALSAGHKVDALSRNRATIAELNAMGIHKGVSSYLHSKDWHRQFIPSDYHVVYITVGSSESTPEGYRQSYIDGLKSALDWSEGFRGRLIFTSSTSVYADSNGDWIDEMTAPAPRDWRGETILDTEKLLTSHSSAQTTAFRLGGIYGPERNRFLLTQKPLPETSDYYLNLVHVQDAADALFKAGLINHPLSPVYNLTDNHPFTRSELQSYVQEHYPDRLLPSVNGSRQSRSVNRRIRADLVQQHLGWTPNYASVFEALVDLV